jgi:hypothetical protein
MVVSCFESRDACQVLAVWTWELRFVRDDRFFCVNRLVSSIRRDLSPRSCLGITRLESTSRQSRASSSCMLTSTLHCDSHLDQLSALEHRITFVALSFAEVMLTSVLAYGFIQGRAVTYLEILVRSLIISY